MAKNARSRSAVPARGAAPATSASGFVLGGVAPMLDIARQLRRWTDGVLGMAGSASELTLNLAKARATEPRQQAALAKAGSMLQRARQAAGMTTQELSRALAITDPALLEQAEIGKAQLPVEVVLRLASVLGRHDPMPFAMKFARTYNPQLWKALDGLGIGSLVALAGRERELANLYRANDDARRLTDADFADVLAFTKTGFDMTVKFRVGSATVRAKRRPAAAEK
jgi:transcriptional regulator with XRE-family HTH domain